MTNLSDFLNTAQQFVDQFNHWASKNNPPAIADHICFKCADAEEFESLRRLFETESGFVYQSMIAKRRIAIIKFLQPIKTNIGDIWYLELSDQKPDGSQVSGFDHIEIYPTEGSMDMLAEYLEGKGTTFEKVVRPHHTTYDAEIFGTFKIRLEDESLVEKIKREEMK